MHLLNAVFLPLLIDLVGAQHSDNSTAYNIDPYLQYRPAPARSLPIQILLTGIVLTLTTVLFIHLLFTAQYHWPLAPVNYALQLSGVTTLLITLVATLCVILSFAFNESLRWPYMLSYIAVNVPPLDGNTEPDGSTDWSLPERATWLVMNATTSGLIQITHIQFLTLLYPSRLEKRLVFAVLGPMAIIAAVMQLIPIQNNNNINLAASSVRNVCNATLSLLFSASLFVWGLFVNRKNAWRTDGGTAAFGVSALTLAVLSTGLNFLYIPRAEEYVWLSPLMWAVVLWQSFLGWWWWVGAGSGLSDDSYRDMKRREKKEKRRKERYERRKQSRWKAARAWKGMTGAFVPRPTERAGIDHEEEEDARQAGHVRRRSDHSQSPRSSLDASPTDREHPVAPSESANSSGSSTTTIPRFVPAVLYHWYASLRYAHFTATHKQAAERAARIRELELSGVAPRRPAVGWGLGSFGMRLHRENGYDTTTRHRRRSSHDEYRLRERRDGRMTDEDDEDERDEGQDRVRKSPRPRSVWWWGPLQRWRLQDASVYHDQ